MRHRPAALKEFWNEAFRRRRMNTDDSESSSMDRRYRITNGHSSIERPAEGNYLLS